MTKNGGRLSLHFLEENLPLIIVAFALVIDLITGAHTVVWVCLLILVVIPILLGSRKKVHASFIKMHYITKLLLVVSPLSIPVFLIVTALLIILLVVFEFLLSKPGVIGVTILALGFHAVGMYLLGLLILNPDWRYGSLKIRRNRLILVLIIVWFMFIQTLFFGWLSFLCYQLNPGSFHITVWKPGAFDFIYYSFVTASTLGFGDITPTVWYTKVMAVTEIATSYILTIVGLGLVLSEVPKNRMKKTTKKVKTKNSSATQ